MKKILSFLLVIALCASLFACGKDNKTKEDVKETAEITEAPTDAPTEEPTATPEPTPTPEPKFGNENIALKKPVEVSGVEKSKFENDEPEEGDVEEGDVEEGDVEEGGVEIENYVGENAVDGDEETRWSAAGSISEGKMHWIKIDLEKTYKIGRVDIYWESCGAAFFIELLDENGTRVAYEFCDAADPEELDLYTENFLGGKEARYVVIYTSKTAYASPYEISIYEQLKEEAEEEKAENLAIKGTATADRSEGDDLTADKAIDADFTTRWAPGGQKFDEDIKWTLDLGAVKAVDEISFYFESNQADYRVQIATDENGEWETVYEWSELDLVGKTTINVGGKDARYVRYLRPAGTEGWCSFYEVEVIGK